MVTYTADWRESCQVLASSRKDDALFDQCDRSVRRLKGLKRLHKILRFADYHFSKRWAALTLAAVLTAGTVGGAWADVQTTETETEQTSAGETEHNQTETSSEQVEQETDQAQGTISQTEAGPVTGDTSVPASTESDETETSAFSEKTVAGSKETVQAETQPVSIETKGAADIQVVVRFDFRGLKPQTATYLTTATNNPITHYSVTHWAKGVFKRRSQTGYGECRCAKPEAHHRES